MTELPKVKQGRPFSNKTPEKTHVVKIGTKAYEALKELVGLESKREYQTQRSQLELAIFRCLKANTQNRKQDGN